MNRWTKQGSRPTLKYYHLGIHLHKTDGTSGGPEILEIKLKKTFLLGSAVSLSLVGRAPARKAEDPGLNLVPDEIFFLNVNDNKILVFTKQKHGVY